MRAARPEEKPSRKTEGDDAGPQAEEKPSRKKKPKATMRAPGPRLEQYNFPG